MSSIQSNNGASNPYASQISALEQAAGNNPQYDQQLQQWLQQMQGAQGGESSGSGSAVSGAGGANGSVANNAGGLSGSSSGSAGNGKALSSSGSGSAGQKSFSSSSGSASSGNGSSGQFKTLSSSGSGSAGSANGSASNRSGSGSVSSGSGSGSSGTMGGDLYQQGDGDCGALSALKGLSGTTQGEKDIQNDVKQNTDGSYTVSLPGDGGKQFNISASDVDQFGSTGGVNGTSNANSSDGKAADALIDACYQDKGISSNDGILQGDLANLVSGSKGTNSDDNTANQSSDDVENFMKQNANTVNNGSEAMMIMGDPNSDGGGWSAGAAHGFTVTGIDTQNNTVSYTNPWDDNETKTMSLSDFAQQDANGGNGGGWIDTEIYNS